MARNLKCQWCKITDTPKDEMMVEKVGEKTNKYYHKHCWDDHLKHKEFLADEMAKKDELNEVIKEIYGVKELPNQAWVFLEKLRFGNPVFGAKQKTDKRYREGYEYPLIKATFEYCSDTIEYWNSVKNFNGFMGAFKYALSIIIDKIYVVEQRIENAKKQQQMMEKHIETVDNTHEEFTTGFKKKTKNADITDFLD